MTTRAWLVRLICAFAFVIVLEMLRFSAAVVADLAWPAGGDLASQLRSALLETPWRLLYEGLGLWLLIGVIGRWPRWGWAGLSAVASLAIFCVVLLPPVLLAPQGRGDVVAAGPQAQPILAFVRRGGLDVHVLYAFESADPLAADMEGWGGIAKVDSGAHAAVSRAALAAPSAQTYAAIGHLLGHYRHGDLWSMALLWSLMGAGFFLAVALLSRPIARAFGQGEASGALDATGPPVVGLIAWASLLIAVPVFNRFDQAINYRADDYAMALTEDPDALCRWLVATEQTDKIDPSPLETLIFYDHPPLKARLLHAMQWKANHGF